MTMCAVDKLSVLIVDDDQAVSAVLGAQIAQAGYAVVRAASARGAIEVLNGQLVDLVISDLRMPEMDGFGLLRAIKQGWPDLPLLMLTAHGNVPLAVQAMRAGASDFLLKPFERGQVVATLERVLAHHAKGNATPPAAAFETALLGASPASQALRERVRRAARSNVAVLICGERGTGKEQVAREIHRHSARGARPLVISERGVLPEAVFEAQLFGRPRAAEGPERPGQVELAEGGTLFLDEVGTLSSELQRKLLRLVQQRGYEVTGSGQTRRADVRLVVATQHDLQQFVRDGAFRADLLYALNVTPIRLPALRERRHELRELVEQLADSFGKQHDRQPVRLAGDAWTVLEQYDWPDNMRELSQLVERLVVLHPGEELGAAQLHAELGSTSVAPTTGALPAAHSLASHVRQTERNTVATALRKAGGNRSLAARILGVSRRTLYNKLAEHGLVDLDA